MAADESSDEPILPVRTRPATRPVPTSKTATTARRIIINIEAT
jgi:hypothetical protein